MVDVGGSGGATVSGPNSKVLSKSLSVGGQS